MRICEFDQKQGQLLCIADIVLRKHESHFINGKHGAVDAVVKHSFLTHLHLLLPIAEDTVLGHLIKLFVSVEVKISKGIDFHFFGEPALDLAGHQLILFSSHFDIVGFNVRLGACKQFLQQLLHLCVFVLENGSLDESNAEGIEADVINEGVRIQDNGLIIEIFEHHILLHLQQPVEVAVHDFNEFLVLGNDRQVGSVELVDQFLERHLFPQLKQEIIKAGVSVAVGEPLQDVLEDGFEEEVNLKRSKGTIGLRCGMDGNGFFLRVCLRSDGV